jgi:hypothetical protein
MADMQANVALPSMPTAESLPEKLKLGAFFTDRLFEKNTFAPVVSGSPWSFISSSLVLVLRQMVDPSVCSGLE